MQTKFITLLLLLSLSLSAQRYRYQAHDSHLSVEFMGLTFHPGGGAVNMVKNYPLKLDKKAYFVANIGVTVAYDYDLNSKWFIRGVAGYLKDCAFTNAGFVHLGIRWKPITMGRHSINGGFGPVLSVREDWHRFEGYNDRDFYGKRVWNGMQYRLFPFGGEVEYQYHINNKWDFQYSVIPGFPAVINSRVGFRMKL